MTVPIPREPERAERIEPAPVATPAIGRGELAVLALVALASSLVAIQFARDAGKLAFFPFFDDVTYLTEAQRRVDAIYAEGMRGWAKAMTTFADPFRERSGFMINLGVLAFLVFGRTAEWAPYLALTALVLGALVLLRVLFREYPFRAFVTATVGLLCVPFARGWTIEFRPDITWGFGIALAVLFVFRRLERSPLWIGLGTAVAVLFKPSALPVSLAVVGSAVVLALAAARWRRAGEGPGLRHAGRFAAGFAVGMIALGFFTLPGSFRYTYSVLFESPEPWIKRGDLRFLLEYYLTGKGGAYAFGRLRVFMLIAIGAGMAWAAWRDRRALGLMAGTAVVGAGTYGIITASPVKDVLLGSAFFGLASLLLFQALLVLADAAARFAAERRVLRAAAAVALVGPAVVLAVPGPRLPDHPFLERGSASHREVQRVNAETYRVFGEALEGARAGGSPGAAMGVVSFGPAVGAHLEYKAVVDRSPMRIQELYGVPEGEVRKRLPELRCVSIADDALEWIRFAKRENARLIALLGEDPAFELRYSLRSLAADGADRGGYYVFCRR